jgi:hypothetical protein
MVRKRLPACLSDLHVRDFDHTSGDNYAPAVCGHEPVAYQLGYLADRKTMCEQDRLATAIPERGKQFKSASACGWRAAVTAVCRHWSETY